MREKLVIKYTFRERFKMKLYDTIISILGKLVLLVVSFVIIYFLVSYNFDIAIANFITKDVLGLSEASFLYQVSEPYIRFFSYASFYEAVKKILPLNIVKKLKGGEKE